MFESWLNLLEKNMIKDSPSHLLENLYNKYEIISEKSTLVNFLRKETRI